MKEEDELEKEEAGDQEDDELQKADDASTVAAHMQSKSEGAVDPESIQDPKLKEIMAAIQEDEQKHQAALQQWMDENGSDEGEGEEDPADETEKNEDDVPEIGEEPDDGGKGELIDQIRAVLEAHDPEMEKADDEEGPEEDTEKSECSEDTEKADDEEEDKPDFLKEDDEEPGKITKSFKIKIMKSDQEEQTVYGVVSEPDTIDLQGDRLSKSEIRKACHKFMIESRKIAKEHNGQIDADIVENTIVPADYKCNGQVVKAHSWVMAVKIHDPEVWQAVKKGEITGFSIAGQGERTPIH